MSRGPDLFHSAANALFFRLRQFLGFRRGGYKEHPDRPWALPGRAQAALDGQRAADLAGRLGLERYRQSLDRETFLAVLFFSDLLDQGLRHSTLLGGLPAELEILDLGSKNFAAAPALHSVFQAASLPPGAVPRRVSVTGIEIDAFRVTRDGHSRADKAAYYLGLLPPSRGIRPHRFLAQDLAEHRETYDLVTWFRPFLDSFPLLRWGLPLSLLRPEELFRHALGLVRPGGRLLILNQTAEEAAGQAALIAAAGWPKEYFEFPLEFGLTQTRAFLHILRNPV